MARKEVAVVGASGFVGSAIVTALKRENISVIPVRAPRLDDDASARTIKTELANGAPADLSKLSHVPAFRYLADSLAGIDNIINAAGLPTATSSARRVMTLANGYLPALIAAVGQSGNATRFVHVSSAATQGRKGVLDETPQQAVFSAYSETKALGERLILQSARTTMQSVIYRPPAVHGAKRQTTQSLARFARSPISCVAAPGTMPTAQALVQNVASAVAWLATTAIGPPRIVIHPDENLTVSSLLELLGAKPPLLLPRAAASATCALAEKASRWIPTFGGFARRLESLWYGQQQDQSWLTTQGWTPSHGHESWRALGNELRQEAEAHA